VRQAADVEIDLAALPDDPNILQQMLREVVPIRYSRAAMPAPAVGRSPTR
jgi:hypothetical protein